MRVFHRVLLVVVSLSTCVAPAFAQPPAGTPFADPPLTVGAFDQLPNAIDAVAADPASLATRVRLGGDAGMQALVQGLLLSGYQIVAANRTMTPKAEDANGFILPFWYVQGLAQGRAAGPTLKIDRLADGAAAIFGAEKADALRTAIAADLSPKGQAAADPPSRFFVGFVSVLAPGGQMTPLEFGLLSSRLAMEIEAARPAAAPAAPAAAPAASGASCLGRSMRDRIAAAKRARTLYTGTTKNIMTALADARLIDAYQNYLDGSPLLLKPLGRLDLGWTAGSPLVRTKNAVAGARLTATAHLAPTIQSDKEFACFSEYAAALGLSVDRAGLNGLFNGTGVTVKPLAAADGTKPLLLVDHGANVPEARLTFGPGNSVDLPFIGAPQEHDLSVNAQPHDVQPDVELDVEENIATAFKKGPSTLAGAAFGKLLDTTLPSGRSPITRRYTARLKVKDWIGGLNGFIEYHVMANGRVYRPGGTHGDYTRVEGTYAEDSYVFFSLVAKESDVAPGLGGLPGMPQQALVGQGIMLLDQLRGRWKGAAVVSGKIGVEIEKSSDCTGEGTSGGGDAVMAKNVQARVVAPDANALGPGPFMIGFDPKAKHIVSMTTRAGVPGSRLDVSVKRSGKTCEGPVGIDETGSSAIVDRMIDLGEKGTNTEIPYTEDDRYFYVDYSGREARLMDIAGPEDIVFKNVEVWLDFKIYLVVPKPKR